MDKSRRANSPFAWDNLRPRKTNESGLFTDTPKWLRPRRPVAFRRSRSGFYPDQGDGTGSADPGEPGRTGRHSERESAGRLCQPRHGRGCRSRRTQGILGLRLGEVLGCDIVNDSLGGCGTYRECRKCGAINAVLASLDGREVTNLASIEVNRAGLERMMQFKIAATTAEAGRPRLRADRSFRDGGPLTANPPGLSLRGKPLLSHWLRN